MEDINPQLTINDIALARDIIDTAVKRGAFGAAEAKQVGTLYEKIDQFIKDAVAQAEAESQPEAEVPETPKASTTKGK